MARNCSASDAPGRGARRSIGKVKNSARRRSYSASLIGVSAAPASPGSWLCCIVRSSGLERSEGHGAAASTREWRRGGCSAPVPGCRSRRAMLERAAMSFRRQRSGSVHYSIFSVVDHYPALPRSVGEFYRQILDEILLAERLGFGSYFLAEHHFHEYGAVPSPPVLLAAAAARTSRIRLGTAVAVLPFHEPVRL